MTQPEKPAPKKPYRTPVLEVYGTIRELTRNVGATGKNDAGSSSKTKTGL